MKNSERKGWEAERHVCRVRRLSARQSLRHETFIVSFRMRAVEEQQILRHGLLLNMLVVKDWKVEKHTIWK